MKLLQKIIPIFLVLSYIVISSQSTIAYLYFKANQNYIAENLCIQKDVEENLCLGNCYLKALQKRLAKDSDKQNKTSTPVKYNFSNPIHEYITIKKFEFNEKKTFVFLVNTKTYKLLSRNCSPPTPPPQIASFT